MGGRDLLIFAKHLFVEAMAAAIAPAGGSRDDQWDLLSMNSEPGFPGCDDHRRLPADKFGRHIREPINAIRRPAVDDGHVLALGETGLFEALAEGTETARHRLR